MLALHLTSLPACSHPKFNLVSSTQLCNHGGSSMWSSGDCKHKDMQCCQEQQLALFLFLSLFELPYKRGPSFLTICCVTWFHGSLGPPSKGHCRSSWF